MKLRNLRIPPKINVSWLVKHEIKIGNNERLLDRPQEGSFSQTTVEPLRFKGVLECLIYRGMLIKQLMFY
ncbi:hypothetical protein NC651_015272 [Populus alba x Populus x berolinensis]|nr:hypothetical protein NC651_015272 [Populus alba x Populus x berolinensis]